MSIFKKNKVNEAKPEPVINTIKCIKVSDKTILTPEWTEEGLLIPMMYGQRVSKLLIPRSVCKNMVKDIIYGTYTKQVEDEENG